MTIIVRSFGTISTYDLCIDKRGHMFPPIALPTTALDGEQVLLQSRCRYMRTTPSNWGYNSITGDLTLTNQRLVFKPNVGVHGRQQGQLGVAGAPVVWFPIRRVIECSEQPMKMQSGRPNVLKLQFDNGGREYFALHATSSISPGMWATALTNAIDHQVIGLD